MSQIKTEAKAKKMMLNSFLQIKNDPYTNTTTRDELNDDERNDAETHSNTRSDEQPRIRVNTIRTWTNQNWIP